MVKKRTTKKPNPKGKSGRPAERLVITDVQAALDAMWKPKPKKK